MAAISLSIVGKNNKPLFIQEFDENLAIDSISEELLFGLPPLQESMASSGFRCSTRHQFIMHAALDRFDQLAGPPPGYGWRKPAETGGDGMFVGFLSPWEDTRIYGYVTTTRIKIMLVVEDDAIPEIQSSIDNDIKTLLSKIHELYVEDMLNPFKEVGSPVVSQRFQDKVQQFVYAFNQSEGML
eukprot:scaffold2243_cov122-Cylindrotheca_fusiformis.AAC.28